MRMDCDQGKLFVGGISFETTEETLKDYFSKYGQVVETVIMRDRVSGNARGFGFVLFSDPSLADKALQGHHVILSRTVQVKKALPRSKRHKRYNNNNISNFTKNYTPTTNNTNQFTTKKIFVGGLSASVTEEEFKAYFDKFGWITDVVVMYDSVTRRPRGFGFITFASEKSVDNVMQQPYHVLNNKCVEVKRAVPKDGLSFHNANHMNYTNAGGAFGAGSVFGTYNGAAVFSPFDPSFNNVFTGYPPPPFSGYPYGGYPIGAYGGVGYAAVAPMVAPRTLWNGPGMLDVRQSLSPMPYGNGLIYPGYMNGGVGGFMSMEAGAYHGVSGPASSEKWNQDISSEAQLAADVSSLRLDGGKSDDESSVTVISNGATVSNQNQSQKGPDEQNKTCTAANSS